MKFVVTKDNIQRNVEVTLPEKTKERIKREILRIAFAGTIGAVTFYVAKKAVKEIDDHFETNIEE